MLKSKLNFEIPYDIKNDLVYCQRALTTHILMHQKLAACVPPQRLPSVRMQKSLRTIEREIFDIGDEQKSLFNCLRFHIDYHQLMKNATIPERERLTCHVRDELQNFASMSSKSDIKPMNVQKRLSEDALYRKYMTMPDAVDDDTSNSRGHSSRNSLSDEPKTEKTDSVISEQISSVSGSDEEKVEILVTPEDVHHTEQRVYNGPRQTVSAAMTQPPPLVPLTQTNRSLLKPMYQRIIEENDANGICVVRPEIGLTKKLEEPKVKQVPKPSAAPQPKPQSQPPQQPATISLFRQRLSAALNKAKDEQQTMHNRIQTESPDTVSSSSPITQALTVKCNSTTSSSSPPQSSKCSPSSIEMDSLNQNEIDPSEMEQANFLRLFGLCTPAYTQYLMNRRPQRKKRTCTSTERTDFHYKFELFEKQFSKRNKRHFLYSPPATRAKRRIASNGINSLAKEVITTAAKKRTKGIKSNASSSSSISSSGSSNYTEKVCVTCYKQNDLLICQKCCGQYHAACHVTAVDMPTRKKYCPLCVRQQKSSSNIKITA